MQGSKCSKCFNPMLYVSFCTPAQLLRYLAMQQPGPANPRAGTPHRIPVRPLMRPCLIAPLLSGQGRVDVWV